jgi:hypothetical protein
VNEAPGSCWFSFYLAGHSLQDVEHFPVTVTSTLNANILRQFLNVGKNGGAISTLKTFSPHNDSRPFGSSQGFEEWMASICQLKQEKKLCNRNAPGKPEEGSG